ncbi:MAG TPA: BatD family protein [Kofleriaceae bacterium]
MRRLASAALVVAITSATVWAQGADPGGSAGAGSAGSASAGSAGSGAAGSANGAGSGAGSAGSGAGSAGSGAGSGSAKPPPQVIIPIDVVPPEVAAAASPSQVRLGDRFTLFITAVYSAGDEVNLREPVELGGDFEVARKRVAADKVRPDGKREREWQLEVYAWDIGELRLPPIAVTFTSQGKAGQVITNTVPIKVTGVLGDLVDDPKLMRDSSPPVRLMHRDWFWLWVGGGAGILIAGALTALYIRNRRRRRVRTLIGTLVPTGPAPRRIDMTSERALQQLLQIERSGVLDREDDRKAGYAEMVDVIREYLGARYRVATLDLTSAELMRSLAKVAPDAERALVDTWLERCDIVKYGGLHASADDAHAVLEAARQLVIATTKVVTPGAKEAA